MDIFGGLSSMSGGFGSMMGGLGGMGGAATANNNLNATDSFNN